MTGPEQVPRPPQRDVRLHEVGRLLGDWRAGSGPLHDRLSRRLGQLLTDGRIGVGVVLPAERRLAEHLGLSRTTVVRSYGTLRDQGLLVSRRGAGSVTRLNPRAIGRFVEWAGALRLERTGPPEINLTKASPAADEEVVAALREAAARADVLLGHHGYHPLGLRRLREEVAARYAHRGVPTTADQVMVTSGAQQAIDLLARTLVRRRETVLVESPTYPGAIDAFRLAGARLVGLDVSTAPWRMDALDALVEQTGARVAYLVPDHHMPTGQLMAQADRAATVAICRARGVTLVVDETLVEVGVTGDPAPSPLAAFDTTDTVVSVGSLSKVAWAGLRVGWIRASPRLIAELARTRTANDLSGAPLEQLAASLLLEDLDALHGRRRAALLARRDTLVAAVRDVGWTVTPPLGGLSAWVELPHGSASQLADLGFRRGVIVIPGPRLSPDGALDGWLRIPFSLPEHDIVAAVTTLHTAWESVTGDRVPAAPAEQVV